MARALRIEFPDAFYHVYSRGNERKEIFRSPADYELFLFILKDVCERFDVWVHAYALMPNHFHILLQTKDANLSNAMKRLLGLYTVRFNRRHKRLGHLFQGRYKAPLVDQDSYLLEVSRYIHLNPVKAKLCKNPEDYPWSSMKYYLNSSCHDFLHRGLILKSFQSSSDHFRFVKEGLGSTLNPIKDAIGGLYIGSEDFMGKLRDKIQKKKLGEFRGKRLFQKTTLSQITPHLKGRAQNQSIYILWKFARLTQRQIGERFGITHSAVSVSIKRFEEALVKKKTLRQDITSLEEILNMSNVED